MAAIILLFLLLVTEISTSTAQQNDTKISLDSSISPSTNQSYWLSNSGQFAFGFYKQGNGFAIGIWYEKINEKTVIWTARRDDQPRLRNATLVLNDFAKVVSPQKTASASMLDSGNFVLHNSESEIIWQSFDNPTDTLLPGQSLDTEKKLISAVSETNHSSGRFQLSMQADGDLIQRLSISTLPYYTYWYSDSGEGDPRMVLNLQANGQLDLLNSPSGSIVKTIHAADLRHLGENFTYRLTIDPDGILRLYSHSLVQVNSSWSIEWSPTPNRCAPTGLCGNNSYCVLENDEPSCTCLRGFDFIDQRQKSLGCQRNVNVDYCKRDDKERVSLVKIDGVSWENNSHSCIPMSNEIGCEQYCLNDCECQIALLRENTCCKMKLPLKNSKPETNSLAMMKIKVPNQSSSDKGRKMLIIIIIVCTIFFFIFLFFSVRARFGREIKRIELLGR